MYKRWLCKHLGHDMVGGSITPPYAPPRCRRCGFVLAERAGITYAEFMSAAQRAIDSGVTIESAKITSGCIIPDKTGLP